VTDRTLSDVLGDADKFRAVHGATAERAEHTAPTIASVLAALHSFTDIVRYLNTRRSSGAILDLTSEASVQDALYLMLRPWILDLVPENPTDKVANRFAIKDFVSHSGRFVIEAKYVRNADHGKLLAKEINDDIETYRYHPSCDGLVFFIYDPDGYIPDAAALERHVRTSRTYDARILRCHEVIKP
jgi:REase_DpnII-MboI